MNKQRMCDILLASHFSEKSSITEQTSNTVVFKITKDATKKEVRSAIEEIFQVSVLAVQTLNVKGKRKRTRFGMSRSKNWKKAYVRLAEGQSINLSEQE